MTFDKGQWVAAGRHVVSVATAMAGILVAVGVLKPTDAAVVGPALNEIIAGVILIVPVIMAGFAWASASMKSRITSVNAGDNGVKVVSAEAVAPMVHESLK